jgi:hypothetical protein
MVCNTTEDLEFDHRDRVTKSFVLSGCYLDRSWNKILEEFAKCDLLCRNCHATKTNESRDLGNVPHGGGLSGKKSCQCKPCKIRKAEYMAKYMQTHVRKRDRQRSPLAQQAAAPPC